MKPCPFCGSTNLMSHSYVSDDSHTVIICQDCRARGPEVFEKDGLASAANEWDRRAK